MSDPKIPAALEPVVAGIVSLHNFHPTPLLVPRRLYTYASGTFHAIVAGDIATIYNLNPVFAAGYSGKGESIMVLEDTYLYSTQDWAVFRKTFGLTTKYPFATLSQVSPRGFLTCLNPGFQGSPSDPGYSDDSEGSARCRVVVGGGAECRPSYLRHAPITETTFGGLIALENVLNGPPQNLPSVVSISYGEARLLMAPRRIKPTTSLTSRRPPRAYPSSYRPAMRAPPAPTLAMCPRTASASAVSPSTPYNVSVGGLDFGYTADNVNSRHVLECDQQPDLQFRVVVHPGDPLERLVRRGLTGFLPGNHSTGPLQQCRSCQLVGRAQFLLNAVGGSGGPSGCATGRPSTSGVVSGSCQGYPKPAWQRGLVWQSQ